MTTGHMRLERAKERFAHTAEEPSVRESPRKKHPLESEGEGTLRRHQCHQTTARLVVVAAVRRRLQVIHRQLNKQKSAKNTSQHLIQRTA